MTINDTVLRTMRTVGLGGYEDRAKPVIDALREREDHIVVALTNYAVEQGMDRTQVRQALADCGLDVQPDAATVDPRIAAAEQMIEQAQATLRELRGE